MPPDGEQAQPRRRSKTGDIGNGYEDPSSLIYSVSSQNAAAQTDDAFDKPEAEIESTFMDPPRSPTSAVKLRPLPGSTRTAGSQGAPGTSTSAIPRRTGQKTDTTAVRGARMGAGAGTGTRSSRLYLEPDEKSRRNVHWLLPLGIGMIAMLLLWVIGSSVLAWGLDRLDDIHYGYPRTYQTDAVVGHGDSKQHPSHFIAINLHGQAIVIEFPAGNPQHAMSYVVPYYIREQGGGQAGDLTPVTVEFRDVTGDGKPDMIVHILFRTQVQTFVFVNTGTKFRPPTGSDNIHL
jgi:hypothetical protein